MAKFAQGRFALSISDRSGLAFPYTEMVREWNGAWVHISEFEKKQPQLQPKRFTADPQALNFVRPARVEPATDDICLLYTSPSPRDRQKSRMPSSA